jgi:hypothetical protein
MRTRGEHPPAAVIPAALRPWPPEPGRRSPDEPRRYPPDGWPTKSQLDYTQQAILTALLVLALPWLVVRLATDPGSVLAGLGRRQTG